MRNNTFLNSTFASVLVLLVATASAGPPVDATTSLWSQQAFSARTETEVIQHLFDRRKADVETGIDLRVPMQSDGLTVPVQILADREDIDALAIISSHGSRPLVTAARFTRPVRGYSTRIRLDQNGRITAYISAGGKLYVKTANIKINVGGYGMSRQSFRSVGAVSKAISINTRINSRRKGSNTEILALITHPMENVQRTNKDGGNGIPANYIEKITFLLNGAKVAEMALSPEVSANPITSIVVPHTKPGDSVSVRWTDSQGRSGMGTTTLK